ncbi:TauD/TfdA family dioxygenase [Fulvivirga sp.]|uniref:TauD/TfdA family dioxygenase n=1 Tax=Fulvivirga sp. TaxID=1931237 RepID=UPI0032EDAE1C
MSFIKTKTELPKIKQIENLNPQEFIDFYQSNSEEIEKELLQFGALKFIGVEINSTEDFEKITGSISNKFLNYIDGTSPRTKVSGNIYTSTEYDASQKITMHNELSYSAKWPRKLFFSCITPAESGGETLLADSRLILQNMKEEIAESIEENGIVYLRNLHAGKGLGMSWKNAFETESKEQVEAHCRDLNIDFEWRANDSLRLKQKSKGIISHWKTGEKIWFNQVDQFHPIQLGKEVYEAMAAIYDSPEDFPTYVTYGNGEPIPVDTIEKILQCIEEVTVAPKWNRNELLIVDNEMVSHGRNPYTGQRRVIVSMSA